MMNVETKRRRPMTASGSIDEFFQELSIYPFFESRSSMNQAPSDEVWLDSSYDIIVFVVNQFSGKS